MRGRQSGQVGRKIVLSEAEVLPKLIERNKGDSEKRRQKETICAVQNESGDDGAGQIFEDFHFAADTSGV